MGAEKNFIRFTALLVDKGYPTVDEDYFQHLVAKAFSSGQRKSLLVPRVMAGFGLRS